MSSAPSPSRLIYERIREISDRAKQQIPSLQKVYRFLRTKPRHFHIRQPSPEDRDAITALCALTQLYASDSDYCLEKRWSTHIWPWIEFLVDNFLTVTDSDLAHDVLDLQDIAIWCIPVIIAVYHYSSSEIMSLRQRWIRDLLKTSPEVFSTTVKLWVCCIERRHPILQTLLDTLDMYRENLDGPCFRDAMAREIISIPHSIRILLNYAVHEATLTKSGADLETLEFVVSSIGLMTKSGTHSDQFITSFLSNHGINSLTSIMKRLSSSNDFEGLSYEDKTIWFECARRLLMSIQQVVYRQRQQSTVVLILQGDLLHSMIHSTAMFEFECGTLQTGSRPSMTDVYCVILKWIMSFMTCRDVLNSFMRSVRRIESQSEAYASFLKVRCPSYASSDLGVVWEALVATVELVKVSRHEYKTEYKENYRHICINPKCPHLFNDEFDVSPKKCSGCLAVIYCSRSCQKQDWKAHRSTCNEERRLAKSTGLPPSVTALDSDFFHWLCVAEVCERSDEIEDLLEDVDKPIAVLDFQEIPASIDVVPLSELKSSESPYPINGTVLNRLHEIIEVGFDVTTFAIFGGDLGFAKGVDFDEGFADDESEENHSYSSDDDDESDKEGEGRNSGKGHTDEEL
ncbi:hypothetical protein VKT23_004820 [Stygiomarasmius scandens]|uniref:MYND-type domain-containing protein n=1 Tax=Marasmiellus scandens TaxID=2682957 RepID=A0ABR1JX72_9AGAR